MNRAVTNYLDNIVERYPDKAAFIDLEREISFKDLKDEALRIAQILVKERIIKKPVLVYMEKSVSMISTFMGIAYSGNFYSPIDTKMPSERVSKILDTLEPGVVITDKKHEEFVKSNFKDVQILIFEELLANPVICEDEIRKVTDRIIDTDTLYVLFTSGSTGVPKGVIINHRAVIDFVDWISYRYDFNEKTVFANQAQLYFDLSIQDVYAPLKNGSTTVLIPNRLYTSPVRVWKIILEKKVNTLVWIPSMLSMFANLDVLNHVERAPLKTILFCGEVMPTKQLNYWIKVYPDVVYGNLYGPTECTEACTYYTIDRPFCDNEVLPIGRACENCEALVVTEDGEVVTKPNVIGELCIRGTCLSDGYYGDITRTKEVFVQNPLNNKYHELIYKTGDLVSYNEKEELIYVCRKDFQIKIRGYRVELGEIEAAASAIEAIEYCCCLFDDVKSALHLVYSGNISEKEVNEILCEKLQEYMIPSAFHKVEKMIFNVNGKIDRRELKKTYIGE